LEIFLAQSPVVEEYNVHSEKQKRSAELRHLLKGKNPFELNLTASESRARLEKILDDLHQPAHPLVAYSGEIFPPSLSESVTGKCQVPYCHREACGENEARWTRLLQLIRTFTEQEPAWPTYADHTGRACRAFFPITELQRIEKGNS